MCIRDRGESESIYDTWYEETQENGTGLSARLVIPRILAQLFVKYHQSIIGFLVGSMVKQLSLDIAVIRPVPRRAVLLQLVQDFSEDAKAVLSRRPA